jgi:hypothetical protein
MSDWHEEKTYDSLITFGQSIIKFILIANGGALVAMLGILGEQPEIIEQMFWPIIIYATGVALGGIINLTAYLTQLMLFNEYKVEAKKLFSNHETWLMLSLAFIVLGIMCFITASILAANNLATN